MVISSLPSIFLDLQKKIKKTEFLIKVGRMFQQGTRFPFYKDSVPSSMFLCVKKITLKLWLFKPQMSRGEMLRFAQFFGSPGYSALTEYPRGYINDVILKGKRHP
jgi:hypothetical protein